LVLLFKKGPARGVGGAAARNKKKESASFCKKKQKLSQEGAG
jgi:hypothetical protein